jgi:hypothetical protein
MRHEVEAAETDIDMAAQKFVPRKGADPSLLVVSRCAACTE